LCKLFGERIPFLDIHFPAGQKVMIACHTDQTALADKLHTRARFIVVTDHITRAQQRVDALAV